MSGAAQTTNDTAQTSPPSSPPPKIDPPEHDKPPGSGFGPLFIALAGAAITATVIAGAMATDRTVAASQASSSAEPTLAKVATVDLAGAAVTLDPAVSQQAVSDAKACKVPIAWVTLAKLPGGTGGTVRIRSGSYLSPAFAVSDAPQRVAIPFPAPYETGRGVLWMVGEAKGLDVRLYPGWSTPSLDGAAPINVVWTPKDPC
jgi:hypothetical protein